VDACGAGGGASRFSNRCSSPGDELLRNGSSAWTNRSAFPFLHVEATSAERRCPFRSPIRCHSVHGTAAQPQRNSSPSTTGDGPLPARRRRHRPKTRHRRRSRLPGAKPPRNTSASGAATRKQGAQPQEEHLEERSGPRPGRRTAHGPPQATPTVKKEPAATTHRPGAQPPIHDDDP
jgi:hypothetical protein